MHYTFLLINGPNLASVGIRCPEIYGNIALADLPKLIDDFLEKQVREKLSLEFYQSNHEGRIIDRLEEAYRAGTDGLVINAGALTHTSLALADCLEWIGIPFVEVHISNVFMRKEAIRHTSLLGKHAMGIIAGFGLLGYALAVRALCEKLSAVHR